jgi:hypothetical protein
MNHLPFKPQKKSNDFSLDPKDFLFGKTGGHYTEINGKHKVRGFGGLLMKIHFEEHLWKSSHP